MKTIINTIVVIMELVLIAAIVIGIYRYFTWTPSILDSMRIDWIVHHEYTVESIIELMRIFYGI